MSANWTRADVDNWLTRSKPPPAPTPDARPRWVHYGPHDGGNWHWTDAAGEPIVSAPHALHNPIPVADWLPSGVEGRNGRTVTPRPGPAAGEDMADYVLRVLRTHDIAGVER